MDHLGSIREVVDSSGIVQSRLDYDIFGQVAAVTGTVLPDFQYAGYYFHSPSGLNLTTFRAYSSYLGRWINRDPAEELGSGTMNLYAYCLNNPSMFLDPTGLSEMGNAIAGAARNLAQNHASDFRNTPGRYTCAIFVNRALHDGGAPPIQYPPGANPGNVGDMGGAMGGSPGYNPVSTSNYVAQPGDVIIFSSHSGIAVTGGC